MSEAKKTPHERVQTDESLRLERRKTDQELAQSQGAIASDADHLVAAAREKADAVLSEARDAEDRKISVEPRSAQGEQVLDDERAREDAALKAERGATDATVNGERARRQLALASLLAFEREETDLRLKVERSRGDEAVRSREDFFAIVSHDLRTLLGGIALSASVLTELAKTDAPIAKAAPYAAKIQRFAAQTNRLIGDLLDVASIEAGKLSMLPEPSEATLLVRDSMEAFGPAALMHGVELTSEIGPGVGKGRFDHERILQVLANLVGNALKFTSKGGRISIAARAGAGELTFSVKDTGQGIPADQFDKIFDRFSQARKNDRRGLGLGLYIARCIIEGHGGKLWAESAVGLGSAFFFTLPA